MLLPRIKHRALFKKRSANKLVDMDIIQSRDDLFQYYNIPEYISLLAAKLIESLGNGNGNGNGIARYN